MVGQESFTEGLETAAEVLVKLLQEGGGDDVGKPIVVVARE
jgi:hypothetical protein